MVNYAVVGKDDMKEFADEIVNAVLFPFGRCRVKLADWPEGNVEPIITRIQGMGGVLDGEGGIATVVDEYYFRTAGGRVKLSIFEYGPIYLWGPKKLVRELAAEE